jgi:hypothetical protein
MDAAAEVDPESDRELETQTAVAKASLETAERRQKSGNDDKPHVPGCRCALPACVDGLRKKRAKDARLMAQKAAADFKTVGDAAVKMVGQLVRQSKRKAALDALNAQRAWDEAIRADEIADERHQGAIANAFLEGVNRAKHRLLGGR